VSGQYSMHVQLTPSAAVVAGGQLDVSCDIWNWQPERSMFVVWLRRAHGSEVELGTNEKIVEQLRDRYSARKELRRPADFTRVSYYLTITGTNCWAMGSLIPRSAHLYRCVHSAVIGKSKSRFNLNRD